MQRKCISAVLWQNPIKHASNIHPNVFNSFYQTVTYGKTHRIIYKEILLSMRWSPHFSACELTSQQKSPKPGTCYFTILPPLSKTSPEDTWTWSLITNFLNINPPQYESNHHKQDLLATTSKIPHCWLQLQIIKSQSFHINVNRTAISSTIMGYRTPGLNVTCLLGRQGKHVWLTARQIPMIAGWWDAPLALRDFAETICVYA